jgi:hypothetical protein
MADGMLSIYSYRLASIASARFFSVNTFGSTMDSTLAYRLVC